MTEKIIQLLALSLLGILTFSFQSTAQQISPEKLKITVLVFNSDVISQEERSVLSDWLNYEIAKKYNPTAESPKDVLENDSAKKTHSKSGLGFSASLYRPDHTGVTDHFFFLHYSREFKSVNFFDIAFGFSKDFFMNEGKSTEVTGSGEYFPISHLSHGYYLTSHKTSFMLTGSYNRRLYQYKNIGFSLFAGLSLFRSNFFYSWGVVTSGEIIDFIPQGGLTEGKEYFFGIPFGISLHLYPRKFVSLKIDLGYYYSPTKLKISYPAWIVEELQAEYPDRMFTKPPDVVLSTSAVMMSLGIRAYF
jgi:hypothetical protein